MTSRRKIFFFIALPLVIIALILFWVASRHTNSKSGGTTASGEQTGIIAPNCSVITPPVNLSLVTSLLYPGQVRGGDYKPHGGFRLDGLKNNEVSIIAPISAKVARGSRYIEQGEVQYMFDFETDCGLDYRLDHLKTLSAKMQAAANTLPAAKIDDSRTSNIRGVNVEVGEVIASAVGFEKGENGPNVGFDLGVYSQKKKNDAASDPAWVSAHKGDGDQATHAICWLDLLSSTDAAQLKQLPGSDGSAGKTSDYCK